MGSRGWVKQNGTGLRHWIGHLVPGFTLTTFVVCSTAVSSNYNHLESLVNQMAGQEVGEFACVKSFPVWLVLLVGRRVKGHSETHRSTVGAVREASSLTSCILSNKLHFAFDVLNAAVGLWSLLRALPRPVLFTRAELEVVLRTLTCSKCSCTLPMENVIIPCY